MTICDVVARISKQNKSKAQFLRFSLVTTAISVTVSDKSRRWNERLLSVIDGVSPRDASDEKLVKA
jgi:hypothetical protein